MVSIPPDTTPELPKRKSTTTNDPSPEKIKPENMPKPQEP